MSEQNLGDAVKRYAPLALGTAAAAGAVVGVDLPPWAIDAIKQWGPAAVLFGFFVYYVPPALVRDFVVAQQKMSDSSAASAIAMQKVGDQLEVLTGQAGKLDEISAKLDDIKFNADVFGDRLTRIEERLIDGKRQNDV